jgi:hypothetical protein
VLCDLPRGISPSHSYLGGACFLLYEFLVRDYGIIEQDTVTKVGPVFYNK